MSFNLLAFKQQSLKKIDSMITGTPIDELPVTEKAPKRNKKKIVGFSILGASLSLLLVGIIIVVSYFNPTYAPLKLNNYRVNLSDADSIGVISLKFCIFVFINRTS